MDVNVYNISKKNIIIQKGTIANTFISRLKGLMFVKSLDKNSGLIIEPCNSIHMCFMKFPLDVLFLDKHRKVVGLEKCIKPWKVSKIYSKAFYVIELPVGIIDKKQIEIGDNLEFYKNN